MGVSLPIAAVSIVVVAVVVFAVVSGVCAVVAVVVVAVAVVAVAVVFLSCADLSNHSAACFKSSSWIWASTTVVVSTSLGAFVESLATTTWGKVIANKELIIIPKLTL